MRSPVWKTIVLVLSIAALVGCDKVPQEDVATCDHAMNAAQEHHGFPRRSPRSTARAAPQAVYSQIR